MAKFCEICGASLSNRAKFCAECGEKVVPNTNDETPQKTSGKTVEPDTIVPVVETIKKKPNVEERGFTSAPPMRKPAAVTPPPMRKPAAVTPPPIRKPTSEGFTPPPTKKTARNTYMAPVVKEAKKNKVKDSYYDPVKPDDADKEEEREKIDTKKMGIAIGVVAGTLIIVAIILTLVL